MTAVTGTKLADQLIKFEEIPGYLSDDIKDRLLSRNVKEFLLHTVGLKVHKVCYDKFNNSKYERALERKKRVSSESTQVKGPPRTRRKSDHSTKIQLGDELCMICDKPDEYDEKNPSTTKGKKLHAAAGKQVASTYVDQFTEDLRQMAAALSDTKLLTRLETRDVRASELYYHNHCYGRYVKR